MVEAGADVNAVDEEGHTALYYANEAVVRDRLRFHGAVGYGRTSSYEMGV